MYRKTLILIALLAFGFSLWSCVTYSTRETAKREAYFQEQEKTMSEGGITFAGPYCFPDNHPQFLLLNSLLLAINLIVFYVAHRSGWHFVSSAITLSVFLYWCYWTQNAIAINETSPPELLERLFYGANEFDIVVLALISTSVLFTGRILLSGVVRGRKDKVRLP